MASSDEDPRLIRLAPADNVLVVRRRVRAGEMMAIGAASIAAAVDLPLGHKVAARAIAAGEIILKYGAPIGIATAAIAPGEHVHVHNVRSAYTPTYTLDAARAEANA